MMKLIMEIVGILLIVSMVMVTLCYYFPTAVSVHSEYSNWISVETPDKIENAISNVVSDLEKRDFVPVNLRVQWHPENKTYVISASGIDRTKLGKYKP